MIPIQFCKYIMQLVCLHLERIFVAVGAVSNCETSYLLENIENPCSIVSFFRYVPSWAFGKQHLVSRSRIALTNEQVLANLIALTNQQIVAKFLEICKNFLICQSNFRRRHIPKSWYSYNLHALLKTFLNIANTNKGKARSYYPWI